VKGLDPATWEEAAGASLADSDSEGDGYPVLSIRFSACDYL